MLILNEEKFARDIYDGKNKEVKSVLQKIGYITRYLLHSLNQSDEENYKNSVKWLKKHHNNFDEIYYSNLISDAIKKAHKKPFYCIRNQIGIATFIKIIVMFFHPFNRSLIIFFIILAFCI